MRFLVLYRDQMVASFFCATNPVSCGMSGDAQRSRLINRVVNRHLSHQLQCRAAARVTQRLDLLGRT